MNIILIKLNFINLMQETTFYHNKILICAPVKPKTTFIYKKMSKLIKIVIASLVISMTIYSCKESKTSTTTTKETGKEAVKVDTCGSITFAMVNTIIVDRCLGCHSGIQKEAGWDLESKEVIMTAAESGKLNCVVTGDGCKKMPPYDDLKESQIKLIQCWVSNGMKE